MVVLLKSKQCYFLVVILYVRVFDYPSVKQFSLCDPHNKGFKTIYRKKADIKELIIIVLFIVVQTFCLYKVFGDFNLCKI